MYRKGLLQIGLSLALVAGIAQASQAGFASAFVGNSQGEVGLGEIYPPNTQPEGDGLINFAVYINDASTPTGNWVTDLGIEANGMFLNDLVGAGPVDETAAYVYFYQLVNTNPDGIADDVLSEMQIERGQFDTGGYLTIGGVPVLFNEAVDGGTGPPANTAIGTATTDPIPGNNVPGFSGGVLDATPFVADASAVIPDDWNRLSSFYEFEFPGSAIFGLDEDKYSTVVFMTSSLSPTYLLGRMKDGQTADGDVPSNTPEPGTFAMTAAALAIAAGAVVARKKSATIA